MPNYTLLTSNSPELKYENYRGHKLDRQMLELLREFL